MHPCLVHPCSMQVAVFEEFAEALSPLSVAVLALQILGSRDPEPARAQASEVSASSASF